MKKEWGNKEKGKEIEEGKWVIELNKGKGKKEDKDDVEEEGWDWRGEIEVKRIKNKENNRGKRNEGKIGENDDGKKKSIGEIKRIVGEERRDEGEKDEGNGKLNRDGKEKKKGEKKKEELLWKEEGKVNEVILDLIGKKRKEGGIER